MQKGDNTMGGSWDVDYLRDEMSQYQLDEEAEYYAAMEDDDAARAAFEAQDARDAAAESAMAADIRERAAHDPTMTMHANTDDEPF